MTDYRQYDDEFDNAPMPDNSGISEVPDGNYECVLTDHREGMTKGDLPKISLFLKIDKGPFINRMLFRTWVLKDTQLPYIRADFVKMGFDLTKYRFSHCISNLNSCYGIRFSVTKKTKDGFVNVYIDKRLTQTNSQPYQYDYPDPKDCPPPSADDVPF